MTDGLREALENATGTSWLDRAVRQSLRAAIAKFGDSAPFPAELMDGAFTYYGVMMQPLGDGRDIVMILGHHDTRRAVAALNRYCREDLELLGMFDDLSTTYEEAARDLEYRWAKLLTRCRRADRPGHKENCETCWAISCEIQSGGWWVQYDFTEDEPGVFPVMIWRE